MFFASDKCRFEVKMTTYKGSKRTVEKDGGWSYDDRALKQMDFLDPIDDSHDNLIPCVVECTVHPMQIYAVRTIQGYSNKLSDPAALGWKPLKQGDVKFLFHMTHVAAWRSIRDHGILPGRMVTGRKGRPEAYFTPVWRDFGGGDQKLKGYPTRGALCVVIDVGPLLLRGHEFWRTRSCAVITRKPVGPQAIVYILDNHLDDPMSDPWFTRPEYWEAKTKDKKTDTVPGGTRAAVKDHAPSSASSGPAAASDWDSWGDKWKDPTPAAASAADEPLAPKIKLIATKKELVATKKEPDFDISQDDAKAFAEVYSIYLKENPGIEEMSIKDRRLWQRYLYRRDTADVPTRTCWYCKEINPLIETKCGNCFRNLSQEGTPARQPDIEDMRISHAIRLGRMKPEAWKFVLRGEGTGNRESQRCKDHYKRARQLGFTDCVHRFLNDPWYRNTCGFELKDMVHFEENGNPDARAKADLYKPMSKRDREAANYGKWVPDMDYGAEQGGNDTNYRHRKPKAKQQKKEDSGWKEGSWPSAGSASAPKDDEPTDEWEKSDWWYK
jgi:hypothetical protein